MHVNPGTREDVDAAGDHVDFEPLRLPAHLVARGSADLRVRPDHYRVCEAPHPQPVDREDLVSCPEACHLGRRAGPHRADRHPSAVECLGETEAVRPEDVAVRSQQAVGDEDQRNRREPQGANGAAPRCATGWPPGRVDGGISVGQQPRRHVHAAGFEAGPVAIVGLEQRDHLAADVVGAAAGRRQERLALFGRPGERLVKQRFNPLPVRRFA